MFRFLTHNLGLLNLGGVRSIVAMLKGTPFHRPQGHVDIVWRNKLKEAIEDGVSRFCLRL